MYLLCEGLGPRGQIFLLICVGDAMKVELVRLLFLGIGVLTWLTVLGVCILV